MYAKQPHAKGFFFVITLADMSAPAIRPSELKIYLD